MKNTKLKGTEQKSPLLRFCRWALVWLCLALFVTLAWMNLRHTAWTDSSQENFGREFIEFRPDSLLLFLIVGPLLFALFRWAERAWDDLSTPSLVRRICWTLFGVGAVWALLVDMTPRADQLTVLSISEQWLTGDYGSFEEGGYLFNFPYQTGVVAMLAFFGRLLGVGKYLPMQVANAGMIALTFWALYKICALMLPEDTAEGRSVLILSTGAWCGLMYSTFVYGNVPSLALAVLSLWLQLRWQVEERPISQLILSGVCLGISVLLKTFSLIFVIAQAILLVLYLIRTRRKDALIWMLVVLLAWQGVDGAVHLWARSKIGHPMNEGAPMIGTIAMGLQANEEGVRAPGWYNGYNIGVYEAAGYDAELAKEMAGKAIQDRVEQFRADPAMARKFFYEKALSQWAEPTYQGFWITCSGDRPHWVEGLFVGPVNTMLVWIMNWFQSLVWVSAAGYLILRRRSLTLEQMLPALVIFGGFLFQLIWEGKGQYTLSYFLLALPYAAAGLHSAAAALQPGTGRKKQNKAVSDGAKAPAAKKQTASGKGSAVKAHPARGEQLAVQAEHPLTKAHPARGEQPAVQAEHPLTKAHPARGEQPAVQAEHPLTKAHPAQGERPAVQPIPRVYPEPEKFPTLEIRLTPEESPKPQPPVEEPVEAAAYSVPAYKQSAEQESFEQTLTPVKHKAPPMPQPQKHTKIHRIQHSGH